MYPEGIVFFKGANFSIQYNKVYTNGSNVNRACAFVRTQIANACKYTAVSVTGWQDPAYGIHIPSGCTKMSVVCQNLQCAINVHKDISESTAYEIDGGSWSATGGVVDYDLTSFIAAGATHVSIGFRNASNTSLSGYTIDENTVQIYFD